MLLRKYNTEIFEPDIRELRTPSSSEIDLLMKRTATARPGRRFFSWHILALAASVMVVCGITFFVMHSGSKGIIGSHGSSQVPQTTFRGQTPATVGVMPKNDEKKMPQAYLADIQGAVKIRRSGQVDLLPSGACEILYVGDIVILEAGAKAKMIYEDAFFGIEGAGQYLVQAPDPVSTDNKSTTPKILGTTRGLLGMTNNNMVVPPRTMLAAVVAPITRANGSDVAIYSPRGASFSDTPAIKIAGDTAKIYEVCVLDLEGKVVGRPINMRGGSMIPWAKISNIALADDEIYHLTIRCGGKIVNDQNESTFWRLSGTDCENLKTTLRQVDSIQTETTKIFFRASALYMNGCHSEALLLVEGIQNYKDDQLCRQLHALCLKALGVSR